MIDMLPNWIKHSQTAFVKRRCIFDNVLMAFEAMDWIEENKKEMIMLLLDFEKAYDRVSWPFLEATMHQMGFEPNWIAMVMSLYSEATAMVSFNGELSPNFQLERSVRQGLPLAPYLYLFIASVLAHMMDDSRRGVLGISLPDDNKVSNMMFADDTNLLLQGLEQNLDTAMTVLNTFCDA